MSPLHQFLNVDGLLGGHAHLLVDSEIVFRVDDYTVEPVHDAEFADAASNADMWSIDFGKNFGDCVFGQAIKIGRTVRPLDDFHSKIPRFVSRPVFFVRRSSDKKMALTDCGHKENLATRTPKNYALGGCSTSEHFARSSEYNARNYLSIISKTGGAA